MKIAVDGVEVFTLTETQKKVFAYEIHKDAVEQEIKDMLKWILEHKFERCFERMKKQWEPVLIKEGAQSIPLKKETFAEHVFKHPKFKNRDQRETEENELRPDVAKLKVSA